MQFQNACTNSKLYKQWKEMASENQQAKNITSRYEYRPDVELYNVIEDKYCIHNIANDLKYSSKVKELDEILKKWMKECGDKGQTTELKAIERKASIVAKKEHIKMFNGDGVAKGKKQNSEANKFKKNK